jgi:hypothetical protein
VNSNLLQPSSSTPRISVEDGSRRATDLRTRRERGIFDGRSAAYNSTRLRDDDRGAVKRG